jgi:hypothetical protein
VPVRLEAVHRIGAGWEIDATFENGKTGTVLQTAALVKQFAYAPWLSPFTPQDFRDMIGRTLTQMADAWNEKHAPNPSGDARTRTATNHRSEE